MFRTTALLAQILTSDLRSPLNLCSFATNAASKLNILRHDSNTLGVNSAQVCILEQSDKVGLGCLLKSEDCSGLEAKVGLEILCYLTNETLEGSLANEQISRLLVLPDLTKSNSSRAVTVRLLDTSGGGCRLAGSLLKRRVEC
jgi:hypothetical protein